MNMNHQKRWGVLLVNLGTPDSTETSDVRRYLRQFLSDPRVLDINPVARSLILNAFILPFRPKKSAEAYEKIWFDEGSPLLVYAEQLTEKLGSKLDDDHVSVRFAMRYQNPSVESAMARFRDEGIDNVVVFPLFPQNASSAYGSAVEEVYRVASTRWNVPALHIVPPYFDHPAFIEAFRHQAQPVMEDFDPDMLLVSFHGVPERHCRKGDESSGAQPKHCLESEDCCAQLVHANRNCYRAQCFATARKLAERLGVEDDRYTVSFQSRLGSDPWIKPYTDEVVEELAEQGVKRIAVACPAFVADCLETLEEIGMELREDFREAGGEDLALIPSLNATDAWVDAIAQILNEQTPVGQVASMARGESADAG
jgi:ferrochelatase